jgi:hypothetical protein
MGFSTSYSPLPKGELLESRRRYCLDEGIGIFDKSRTSNIQTANEDVARTKDSILIEQLNSRSNRIPTGVKR